MRLAFATGMNGEFSYNGELPWGTPIKEDMNHFVKFCAGKVLIMGYKTWKSLPEKVREKYKTLVVFTRKDDTYHNFEGLKFIVEDMSQFTSFIEFLSQCEEGLDQKTEYCVIGGAGIVEACLKNLENFDAVLHTLVDPKENQLPHTQAISNTLITHLDTLFKRQDPYFYENESFAITVTEYYRD